jgi:hypothetical protein
MCSALIADSTENVVALTAADQRHGFAEGAVDTLTSNVIQISAIVVGARRSITSPVRTNFTPAFIVRNRELGSMTEASARAPAGGGAWYQVR